MANTIIGKVHEITPPVTIVSQRDPGKSITKRTIVLSVTRYDSVTGEKIGFDNFPSFEFYNDKCSELDKFAPGQIVSISFDVQGQQYTDKAGQQRWINSVRGYKIELYNKPQQMQVQGQPPQQQQMVTPSPAYRQAQQMYAPSAPQPYGQQQPYALPKSDGLPF